MNYIDRYHYLGFKTPFGAHLRYFITGNNGEIRLGCLQFSSPALKVQVRDSWIGWSEPQRKKNLQHIVQNSRFLIFPSVNVKNLASKALSQSCKALKTDWPEYYGMKPVLLETFVDTERFEGTCYKASNWQCLGTTKGRGRMDRKHTSNLNKKSVWVKPLFRNWQGSLCT